MVISENWRAKKMVRGCYFWNHPGIFGRLPAAPYSIFRAAIEMSWNWENANLCWFNIRYCWTNPAKQLKYAKIIFFGPVPILAGEISTERTAKLDARILVPWFLPRSSYGPAPQWAVLCSKSTRATRTWCTILWPGNAKLKRTKIRRTCFLAYAK